MLCRLHTITTEHAGSHIVATSEVPQISTSTSDTCGPPGPNMFSQLKTEIESYKSQNHGRAQLQIYDNPGSESNNDSSDNDEKPPPVKKIKLKKKKSKIQPMVLAICTPLMVRAHQNLQQAGEMVFCDSTSSLDRFNTSVFILSTATPTSGIPLGVILTSDEQQLTIRRGLQVLGNVIPPPQDAFNRRGIELGPSIVMTDDSSSERGVIQGFWQHANILLCTFHFLQRRWTWLYEAKNRIHKADRITLLSKMKEFVYAQTEEELQRTYERFSADCDVCKYPQYIKHVQLLWPLRKEWAHCYRKTSLVRGNHTNNYAEAGMHILKELVFSRVKAYNLLQMFYFITETMERYYQSKLMSVAHSRFDRFISLRYQGLNAKSYAKERINEVSRGHFTVSSATERGVTYDVDMDVGIAHAQPDQMGHHAAIKQPLFYTLD